jgi:hypothetical protein
MLIMELLLQQKSNTAKSRPHNSCTVRGVSNEGFISRIVGRGGQSITCLKQTRMLQHIKTLCLRL